MDIRQIALYLAGKLPPHYTRFPRLKFYALLEKKYGIDTIKASFYREQANKYEEEFYQLVLEYLHNISLESIEEKQKFDNFLELIGYTEYSQISVPKTSITLKSVDKQLIDLTSLENFLDLASEEDFGRWLMCPLLNEMGFIGADFYGKVYEKDYGLDMYAISYKTPFEDEIFLGIQLKKINLSNGSTNPGRIALKSEIDDAFNKNPNHKHISGSTVKIDGIIIITSNKKTTLEVDTDINNHTNNKSMIRIYDRESIYKWCQKYELPQNIITKITNYKPKRTNKKVAIKTK